MTPADTQMNTKYHGGLVVPQEMEQILAQSGFISDAKGAERLRRLFLKHSETYNPDFLSKFGVMCFYGYVGGVRQMVESSQAPDLTGTETPYHFGYATIVISGSQVIDWATVPQVSELKHAETLSYLLSKGAPADAPDIVGYTALHHILTIPSDKPLLNLKFIRILITEGNANVDYQNRYGEVPLAMAINVRNVEICDLLLEHGARMDLKDGNGESPEQIYLRYGPKVTAVVSKWLGRRRGIAEGLREEKKCERCGIKGDNVTKPLKNCRRCQVARYCSKECQVQHWPTHKLMCKPFSPATSVTVRPYYFDNHYAFISSLHTSSLKSKSNKPTFPTDASATSPKPLIIKVQVPYSPLDGAPSATSMGMAHLMVYTKKRDLMCHIRRQDGEKAYDEISKVVREKGPGGAKAYFAAELRGKDELSIKVSEVLAVQQF
ncbi:hypothetical protein AX15_002370 [Amanita polypyramis BW_CC]|nr:hypothetical protein AX15_002370 [Amanita polypyramis BW_CC]